MMKTIVTLTLNPAIDKLSTTDKLIPEAKIRCSNPIYQPGGGGVNVTRAISKLGGKSIAVFPVGGHRGDLYEKLLLKEGIDFKAQKIKGTTRENFTVVETSTNRQFRFTLEGPTISLSEAEGCLDLIKKMEVKPDYLVSSGSLPHGLNEDFIRKIAQTARELGAKLIIDTSGNALKAAVEEGVYLLKPNVNELAALTGRETITAEEVDEVAEELIDAGKAEIIVVSLGASGALLVSKDGMKHIPAPAVPKKSTVGAGDSMVAGMILKLAQGESIIQMAQYGVACGTAATMNAGTELCKKEDADRLYQWIARRS
jgi:6-phosphofructokinase 2